MSREQVVGELAALAEKLFAETSADDSFLSDEVGNIINDLNIWWNVYQQQAEKELGP